VNLIVPQIISVENIEKGISCCSNNGCICNRIYVLLLAGTPKKRKDKNENI